VVLKAVDLLWILLLTWLFGRFLDRRRFAGFGLRRAGGWLGDALLGLILGAAQMVAIVAVAWLVGWIKVTTLPYPINAVTVRYISQGLLLFVLVAVGEELLFRGYVQTNLQEGAQKGARASRQAAPAGSVGDQPEQMARAGAGGARAGAGDAKAGVGLSTVPLAVSSIVFGLFHALNSNLTWLAAFNLILAGVALGFGYWVTGRLWLPIAYHLSWNFVQGPILGLPVSGMRYGGLLIVADLGKAPTLTGHHFGPEGGLLGTAMLLGTVGVFWWWGRSTGRLEGGKGGRSF
jgi:membrane protease YdiL (CAAX protease family)